MVRKIFSHKKNFSGLLRKKIADQYLFALFFFETSEYLLLNLFFYLYSICLKLSFISNHLSALGETTTDLFLLLAFKGQYSLAVLLIVLSLYKRFPFWQILFVLFSASVKDLSFLTCGEEQWSFIPSSW